MSKHHKYGPSALASYELCSHYEPKPDDGTVHPVTEQGTRCHNAIENKSTKGLTQEEIRLVQWCEKKLAQFTAGAEEHFREVLLNIGANKDGSHLLFGTVDHVALSRSQGVGVVADYKFGYHGVDAADTNIQGQAYVLGVFEMVAEIEELVLAFFLTRRNETTHHTYTRADIDRIRARIETIIERAEGKMGKPTPYPHNCLYCANKAGCEAWIEMGLALREKYSGEKLKLDVDALVTAHGSQTAPDPDQMEMGLLLAQGLGDWAEAYKHHIKKLALEKGIDVPGHEIVNRRGKVILEGTASEIFNIYASQHIPLDVMLRACVPDMTKLVTELKRVTPRGQKGKVEGELFTALTEHGLMKRGADSQILQRKKKQTK